MDLHFYDCILKKLGAFGEMRGKGDGFCGRAEVVGVRHFLSCIHTQLYFVFCICAFRHFCIWCLQSQSCIYSQLYSMPVSYLCVLHDFCFVLSSSTELANIRFESSLYCTFELYQSFYISVFF